MIRSFTVSEILPLLDGELVNGDVEFSGVSTDTRTIQPGDLFIALKGENFDGHKFVANAITQGAVAAVVTQFVEGVDAPQLKVNDAVKALGSIAKFNCSLFNGKSIALTGSCGKTTVKEMLITILSLQGSVSATKGNLNNHIGVPQTLLKIEDSAEFAVVEMGASGMGEIDYLASLANAKVALVNNVGAAHIEGFGSWDGVAEEKSKIYRHLAPSGVAIINSDEPYSFGWVDWLQENRPDVSIFRFSMSDSNVDCFAENVSLDSSGGYAFDLCYGGEKSSVILPLLGKQNVANALAATCCSIASGLKLDEVAKGLCAVEPVPGRMQPHRVSTDLLIIDDSYNANPTSVLAAAQLLMDFHRQGHNITLVLGNLAELGIRRLETLRELGCDLQRLGLTSLVVVSDEVAAVSEGFAESATKEQSVRHFATKQQAQNFLKSQAWSESVILIKGSRSAHMEDIVSGLTMKEEP